MRPPSCNEHGPGPLTRLALPLAMLAVLAVLLLGTDLFAGDYVNRIVIGIGINIILVVALNLSNGFTGVFSLGHIGFMAIGAYTASVLTLPVNLKEVNLPDLPAWLPHASVPFFLATILAGVIAMLVAFVIGTSLMRLNGAYVSVATLGFLVIVYVVLLNWDQVTRGARTFAGVPSYSNIWNVWGWAVFTVFLAWRISVSPAGRDMMAVRDNEAAAQSLGINVLRSRLLAFCVSAFLTGVAGSMWAHFITAFSPKAFYFTQAFSVITMLVIGGMGSVSGSVIGVLLVTIVSEILRNGERGMEIGAFKIPPIYGASQVLMAIMFILVIVFKPSGLTGGKEIDIPRICKRLFPSKRVGGHS